MSEIIIDDLELSQLSHEDQISSEDECSQHDLKCSSETYRHPDRNRELLIDSISDDKGSDYQNHSLSHRDYISIRNIKPESFEISIRSPGSQIFDSDEEDSKRNSISSSDSPKGFNPDIKTSLKIMGFAENDIEIAIKNNPNMNLNELAEVLCSISNRLCGICQVAVDSDNLLILECNDQYCKACFSEYLKVRILESQVLLMPCPNHECRIQIPEHLIQLNISEDLFSKYNKFRKVEELCKQPFLRWCPKPDCEGYDIGKIDDPKLKCNKCSFDYCFYCSEAWHGKNKCKNRADKQLDKFAKNHGLKFCPNCKRKVEKNLGCDHMTCVKCRYEWCWLCGNKYHSGHYDECEVKKLSKKNPPWLMVLRLFFAPYMIPFMCIILCCSLVYKIDHGAAGSFKAREFVRKRLILSYFIAILFGLILSPAFFAIAPFALSIGLWVDCVKNHCCRNCGGKFFGVLLGVASAPFLMICIIIGAIICHFCGICLLVWKTYIVIRRCKEPNYFMPNVQYGYE